MLLSWNPCWLVDPSRLKGTSSPTVQDGRRGHESNASAVHDCVGGVGQAEHGIAERTESEQTASSERACGIFLFLFLFVGGGGQRDASVFGRSRHRVCNVNLVTLKVPVKK